MEFGRELEKTPVYASVLLIWFLCYFCSDVAHCFVCGLCDCVIVSVIRYDCFLCCVGNSVLVSVDVRVLVFGV